VSADFFLRLFFVPVSLAVADESAAVESAEAFFFDFLLLVLEAALSSVAAASFFAFLDFFLVVVVSVLWSLVLVCGLASAGTDKASNRHRAAIHVASFMGSLLIWVLFCVGRSKRPQGYRTAKHAFSRLALGWDAKAIG
jgi:hypothetical protein